MSLKIGTLNLCLGLAKKKDNVINDLILNQVDICCLQETELGKDYPVDQLNNFNYLYESEYTSEKSRVGLYIRKHVEYRRREDLETPSNHLIIIDVISSPPLRIINLYRSFRPNCGMSPTQLFRNQLDIIGNNVTPNTIVLGDFNLNFKMQFRDDYPHKLLYGDLNTTVSRLELFQLVDFDTWERTINNVYKSSILDHIYVTKNITHSDCTNFKPLYGDHLLVMVDVYTQVPQPEITVRRDWQKYSTQMLIQELNSFELNFDVDSVQEYWNSLENVLINVADKLAPLKRFSNDKLLRPHPLPNAIKKHLNKRKRLLKKNKTMPSTDTQIEIKQLNMQIRRYFYHQKVNFIKNKIIPGNSKTLWDAVALAKNLPKLNLPKNMIMNGIPIAPNELSNKFAEYFEAKVEKIVAESVINQSVYNGTNKIIVDNRCFMNYNDVKESLSTLKSKNCEGFDRIPLRIINDAREILLPTLAILFKKIYEQKSIPEQWKVAKVIPIHKKGSKTMIENYRPISNLCSLSKVFEKLILKQIHYLEKTNKLDFTGKSQHGFKKGKSTASAGLLLQSLISHSTDEKNYVLMASLDLSSAFDIVNTDLLVKRLKILGFPSDLLGLIKNWLTDRCFYVEVNGTQSYLHQSNAGTVQGSILGPILYAIFVSPLFDLTKMTNFADDNFVLRWNKHMEALIEDMEMSLEMIIKWLKDSGLKVNEAKTEVCLYHRNDQPPINVRINNVNVTSKKSMNVLGITFDSKLNWGEQTANAIKKANRSLQAIKIISKYFNKSELSTMLKSNFFSILYYNSEIWLTPSLLKVSKNHLMTASALAINICRVPTDELISYVRLHQRFKFPTPDNMIMYKSAILLFKLFNHQEPSTEWIPLNNQIITGTRQSLFEIIRTNNHKIGNNILVNRLAALNKQILLEWLNKSYLTYKWLCKHKFFP